MPSLHDFSARTIFGEERSLRDFAGKAALVVNVASKCGYTPQYADLQKLHEMYGKKVTILGFPANNFGGQPPGGFPPDGWHRQHGFFMPWLLTCGVRWVARSARA